MANNFLISNGIITEANKMTLQSFTNPHVENFTDFTQKYNLLPVEYSPIL